MKTTLSLLTETGGRKISTWPLFFIGPAPTIAPGPVALGRQSFLASWLMHRTGSVKLANSFLGKWPTMMTDDQIEETRTTLSELQVEHRDLDLVIEHLAISPPADDLLIRRLKKRKLLLKDHIAQLEHLLEPSVLA